MNYKWTFIQEEGEKARVRSQVIKNNNLIELFSLSSEFSFDYQDE